MCIGYDFPMEKMIVLSGHNSQLLIMKSHVENFYDV
jgi:hypothetical protein